MMKQKPTLEQRFLQISQVPSLSKSIQQANPPLPPSSPSSPPHPPPASQHSAISCPHAVFSSKQGGKVWNQINSSPHLLASGTPLFPQKTSSEQLGWRISPCLFVKEYAMATKNSSIDPFLQEIRRHCQNERNCITRVFNGSLQSPCFGSQWRPGC